MAKSRTIRVTPNLMKCLAELTRGVKGMPQGEPKKRAQGALDYLSRTFHGERQPLKGAACPPQKLVIK
jgi:hypothetical protein